MIRSGEHTGDQEDQIARNKINQIHQSLLNEPSIWPELVNTYSEDEASKVNKGLIPWFGVGAIVPEFEHAAFSLKIKEIFRLRLKQTMVTTSLDWKAPNLYHRLKKYYQKSNLVSCETADPN